MSLEHGHNINTDDLHSLYVEHGFFWNSEIAKFVLLYGGKEVVAASNKKSKGKYDPFLSANLYIKKIRSECALTAAYLGEDIAPVVDYNSP